jgi:hypothetical protein
MVAIEPASLNALTLLSLKQLLCASGKPERLVLAAARASVACTIAASLSPIISPADGPEQHTSRIHQILFIAEHLDQFVGE